jgi:hypothetical protein
MIGWLEAFRDLGLARYDTASDQWVLTAAESNMLANWRPWVGPC